MSYNADHAPGGRDEGTFVSSYASYFREQTKGSTAVEDYDYSEEAYEQDKPSWKKGKADAYFASPLENRMRRADSRTKWKNVPEVDANDLHSDEDLNALLKVEALSEFLNACILSAFQHFDM